MADLPSDARGRRFAIRDVPAARRVPGLAEEVRAGFARTPRELPPKYFYDDHGSALFERICDTPEYYPTRSEAALLSAHADDLVAAVRPDHIIELGAGTARKTATLLAACERAGIAPVYWPYDVCAPVLEAAGAALLDRFAWLHIEALVGDYTAGLEHLPRPAGRRLYVFLGGTIGNFEPAAARALLGEIARHMDAGDRLLLGADRLKERAVMEAAYNDSAGVTAEFNRNVLRVLNRELYGDFDVDGFRHEAVFDAAHGRIEMYLVPRHAQTVTLAALGERFHFAAGEPLRTEISRKLTAAELTEDLHAAGLVVERAAVAPGDYFCVNLAARAR